MPPPLTLEALHRISWLPPCHCGPGIGQLLFRSQEAERWKCVAFSKGTVGVIRVAEHGVHHGQAGQCQTSWPGEEVGLGQTRGLSKVAAGDIAGAQDASKKAKIFSYIGLGVGLLWVIFVIIYVVFVVGLAALSAGSR